MPGSSPNRSLPQSVGNPLEGGTLSLYVAYRNGSVADGADIGSNGNSGPKPAVCKVLTMLPSDFLYTIKISDTLSVVGTIDKISVNYVNKRIEIDYD